MTERTLERRLCRKDSDPGEIARAVARSPGLLEQVIQGLRSDTATVRFNSSKVLLAVARETPEAVQPRIGSVLAMLDSENKILKSAAIRTLGYLAPVDSGGRITRSLPKILEPIPGPDLVVASNAIEGASRIALAKPKLTDRVVPALLSVSGGRYRTAECRNIAIGKAIDALHPLHATSKRKSEIEKFVRDQRRNKRKSTRARVERFLRQTT